MNLAELVALTDGFSGAEIEQGIVSSLYAAHALGQHPDARPRCRRAPQDPPAVGHHGRARRRRARVGARPNGAGRIGPTLAGLAWKPPNVIPNKRS